MEPLEPPDTHYLSAAVGWLELGNLREAKTELAHIQAAKSNHPDVLELRWLLCAQEKSWEPALEIARELVRCAPGRASGWLHQAYALRRVPSGGLEQAWDALLPAYEKFPTEPVIPYNLACYACQMQQLASARLWLERAVAIAGKSRIHRMALADPDLEPLWTEIRKM